MSARRSVHLDSNADLAAEVERVAAAGRGKDVPKEVLGHEGKWITDIARFQ